MALYRGNWLDDQLLYGARGFCAPQTLFCMRELLWSLLKLWQVWREGVTSCHCI